MTARTVAVVTGAGGGLGLACARALAGRHALVLADADAEALRHAREALRGDGADALAVRCDVTRTEEVAALADAARSAGELGALVHAAGLGAGRADGGRILVVNLAGTALVLEAFEPLARSGTVAICFASLAGHRRRPRDFDHLLGDPLDPALLDAIEAELGGELSPRAGYEISKRGVILLCERRAARWGAAGARLVSVSPGLVDAGMGRASRRHETVSALTAVRRLGTADDIAGVVAFLCSDAAAYVTATDILVDGGAHAGMRHHAPSEVALELDSSW
jgi:NAD(P)-dependent dehydrogenase (short-subunit alcohol dehydrogenase family)